MGSTDGVGKGGRTGIVGIGIAFGIRAVFGVGRGVGILRVGYIEGSTVGIGLIVTSTFGLGVDSFKRKRAIRAMAGKTV